MGKLQSYGNSIYFFCKAALDPAGLGACLRKWLDVERVGRGVVAVDGKTMRGSANAKHGAYHVVSAFAVENRLVLGEICVTEKSNEIEAVPELLDMIDVPGAVVTADAMSCQKAVAAKIVQRGADYVLSLKGNQPELLEDVRLYFGSFGVCEKGQFAIEHEHFAENGFDVPESGKIRARKQEENDVQGRAQSRSPAGRAFPWKKVNTVAVREIRRCMDAFWICGIMWSR